MMDASGPLPLALDVAWGLLGGALLFAFLRLVRGPTLPDRVVALDLFGTLAVGIIAVDAIATQQLAILDVAIIVSLISFVGTVAFAYYVEKGGRRG